MNTLAAGAFGLEIKCTGQISNTDPGDPHVAYRLSVQRHSTEVAKVERRWTEIKDFDRALYQLNSVSSHATQSVKLWQAGKDQSSSSMYSRSAAAGLDASR